MKFDQLGPLFEAKKILSPHSVEHEVQAYMIIMNLPFFQWFNSRYAIGSFSAHYCGDYRTSKKCINKARQLSGSIFDANSVDAGIAHTSIAPV